MAMISAIQEAQKDNVRSFNGYMMKVLEVSMTSYFERLNVFSNYLFFNVIYIICEHFTLIFSCSLFFYHFLLRV